MTLFDILLFLVIFVVGYQFWRIRAISEAAKSYLEHYCQKQQLQLISIARAQTRLGVNRGKLDWHCRFHFEFSGNGEDSYQGEISMQGLRVQSTEMPAYKI